VPAGTSVAFSARTANTLPELAGAMSITIATDPPDESPASIVDAFDQAGITHGTYLQVTASLSSQTRDAAPTLDLFTISHSCSGIFQ
jgi:hypothetical protein